MSILNWAKEAIKADYAARFAAAEQARGDDERAAGFGKVTVTVVAGNAHIKSGEEVTIIRGEQPGSILVKAKGKRQQFTVTGLSWQEKQETSTAKTAATALAGGILTGGLGGVLLGAAAGARKQDNSTAILQLGECNPVYIRCSGLEYEQLSKIIYS